MPCDKENGKGDSYDGSSPAWKTHSLLNSARLSWSSEGCKTILKTDNSQACATGGGVQKETIQSENFPWEGSELVTIRLVVVGQNGITSRREMESDGRIPLPGIGPDRRDRMTRMGWSTWPWVTGNRSGNLRNELSVRRPQGSQPGR